MKAPFYNIDINAKIKSHPHIIIGSLRHIAACYLLFLSFKRPLTGNIASSEMLPEINWRIMIRPNVHNGISMNKFSTLIYPSTLYYIIFCIHTQYVNLRLNLTEITYGIQYVLSDQCYKRPTSICKLHCLNSFRRFQIRHACFALVTKWLRQLADCWQTNSCLQLG